MSNSPFMQLYVGDYMADTTLLTTEQHGAYLLLLMTMWRHDAKLPNDPRKLARIARTTVRKWPAIWDGIEGFFEVSDGVITNKRLTKEHQKAVTKSELRANAGSLGGKAKALKDKETPLAKATVLPQHSSESEPYSKKEEPKGSKKEGISELPDGFEEFWEIVPRKDAKKQSIKAFKAAVKKTPISEIMAGMKSYARSQNGKDPQFILLPSTWLNNERWLDGKAKASQASKPTQPDEALLHFEAQRERRDAERRAKRPGGPSYVLGQNDGEASNV